MALGATAHHYSLSTLAVFAVILIVGVGLILRRGHGGQGGSSQEKRPVDRNIFEDWRSRDARPAAPAEGPTPRSSGRDEGSRRDERPPGDPGSAPPGGTTTDG